MLLMEIIVFVNENNRIMPKIAIILGNKVFQKIKVIIETMLSLLSLYDFFFERFR